jgi:CRP-like cAMP-binding protein
VTDASVSRFMDGHQAGIEPSPPAALNVPGRNRVLDALPVHERDHLLSLMVRRSFNAREVVLEAGQPIHHAYFPLHGAASLLVYMQDGGVAEVNTVGNEGMLGVPLLHAVDRSHTTGIFHTPAEAFVMTAADLQSALTRGGALAQTLQRYAHGFVSQTCQLAACNRLHAVEQRFCRWLLMTHDRVGRDSLALTQEFVAVMLGVRRATVNIVACGLQRSGAIRYRRGAIAVLDRHALEERSCECYAIIRNYYEDALGAAPPDDTQARPRRATAHGAQAYEVRNPAC